MIGDTNALAKILSGLRPSDLVKVANSSKFNTAIALMKASLLSKGLTSVQRASLFNMLMSGAAFKNGQTVSYPNNTLNAFNSTNYIDTAELFIEAP